MSDFLPRIIKLSSETINRIKAGEVIERPASALKEILENSIDAKATCISVELIEGGLKKIKVIDNGHGIVKDDLPLALDTHATSKIITDEDLYKVTTLGFRGEGLASIAAVSNLSLASITLNSTHGYKIISTFGEIKEVIPYPLNIGTHIEIDELYHNIPARKKFLKTANTEYSHCKSVFERIALSYPNINFDLKHNDKIIYKLFEESLSERIASVLGSSYSLINSIELSEVSPTLSLKGYIFHPGQISLNSNKQAQYFFINGRFVRDKVVQNAIKQGFSGVLHHEHQPQYVLFLTINPTEIDVNVHPTKSEVRFHNSHDVHNYISSSIRKALAKNSFSISDKSFEEGARHFENNLKQRNYENNSPPNYSFSNSSFKSQPTSSPGSSFNSFNSKAQESNFSFPNSIENTSLNIRENFFKDEEIEGTNHEETLESISKMPPLGFALGVIHGAYILSQSQDGLIIVDMHASHERIILEKLKSQLATSSISREELLFPVAIESLPEHLLASFEEHEQVFLDLGFDIQINSNKELMVKVIPTFMQRLKVRELIIQMLNEISEFDNSNLILREQEKLLGNIACKCAIKANDSISLFQMNAILRDMENLPRTGYCNHGRPTWLKISLTELDQMFMRGK